MSGPGTAAEMAERVLALAGGARGASGIEVILAEPGRVHRAISRRDDLLQFRGYFPGGVISGLADLAAGGAVTTALPPGRAVVSISLHVNFLAPAEGEEPGKCSRSRDAFASPRDARAIRAGEAIVRSAGGHLAFLAFSVIHFFGHSSL